MVQFGGRLSADFKKSLIDSVRNKSTELQEVQTTVDNAQVVSKTVNEDCEKSVRCTGKPTGSSKAKSFFGPKSSSGIKLIKNQLITNQPTHLDGELIRVSQNLR